MENYISKVIEDSSESEKIYCKFLSPNDSGETGGHQSGFLVSKPAYSILFDEPGEKGGDIKRSSATIYWFDDYETPANFIYYGSKDEYRVTSNRKSFPSSNPDYTGALLIFLKKHTGQFKAYIFNTDDEINEILNYFGITPAETNS